MSEGQPKIAVQVELRHSHLKDSAVLPDHPRGTGDRIECETRDENSHNDFFLSRISSRLVPRHAARALRRSESAVDGAIQRIVPRPCSRWAVLLRTPAPAH